MNAKRKTLGLGHRSAQAESKPQRLSWDGFRKALRLHVWPDRMQTLEALKHLWERMPAEEMEELPAMTLVLAVGTELDGACVPRPLVLNPRVEDAGDPAYALGLLVKESVLIFLDARLEGRPQEEVDWVVAHEFAHALRMREPEQQGLAAEQEVDQLVQTWGFYASGAATANAHRRCDRNVCEAARTTGDKGRRDKGRRSSRRQPRHRASL